MARPHKPIPSESLHVCLPGDLVERLRAYLIAHGGRGRGDLQNLFEQILEGYLAGKHSGITFHSVEGNQRHRLHNLAEAINHAANHPGPDALRRIASWSGVMLEELKSDD